MKKVYSVLFVTCFLTACSVENINTAVPVLETLAPESVQTNSAALGGVLINEAGTVTETGIAIGTSETPGANELKVPMDPYQNTATFAGFVENLLPATTYYFRAYGTNQTGTGYGETFSFTTQETAACNPATDNYFTVGYSNYATSVLSVFRETDMLPFNDGNQQFYTYGNSAQSIGSYGVTLQFLETGGGLPLTGTYTTVYEFDNHSTPSSGEIKLYISPIGNPGSFTGIPGMVGQKVYVENTNGIVTFIFCDTQVNQQYTLNGKFTYGD
jgi:hypothetical protein